MRKTPGEQPVTHSNADHGDDGRMYAPSAARNIAPILDALAGHVPQSGTALEIASGTGEHAVAFARRFPGVEWQPTDISTDRMNSIDAWRAAEAVGNLRTARLLDAGQPGWSAGPFDLVIVVNLFHLIDKPAAAEVIKGAARALNPGGRFFIYGPFRTQGAFRSDNDRAFHANLTADDPGIGYKDLEWVQDTCAKAGLIQLALIEMPSNNLALVSTGTGT